MDREKRLKVAFREVRWEFETLSSVIPVDNNKVRIPGTRGKANGQLPCRKVIPN